MMPVSPQELLQLQNDAASATCDQPCVIARKTMTVDGLGTQSEVYAVTTNTKAGISEPSGGQLANYAYVIGTLKTFQVKLPIGTVVQEQDRLYIAGNTLTVQVLLNPRSYPSLLTVLASEVV